MTRDEAKDRVVEATRALGAAMDNCEECDDEFRKLWAALAVLDATPDSEGGWQPIETAPKDGTFVLAAMASGFVCILQYCADNYWRPNVRAAFKECVPIYWQPLPTAPLPLHAPPQ